MSMSDPLGDMLTRIRNGQRARQAVIASPASKMRANVLEVLKREGYIRGFSREDLRPGVAEFKIELKYVDGEPVIREIARVSKPGRRIYSRNRRPAAQLQRPRHFDPVDAARGVVRQRGARGKGWRRSLVPGVLRI